MENEDNKRNIVQPGGHLPSLLSTWVFPLPPGMAQMCVCVKSIISKDTTDDPFLCGSPHIEIQTLKHGTAAQGAVAGRG